MDVDAFVAAHQAEWDRLDRLVARRRRLSGEEVDELVTAYQRTATHLSAVRTAGYDPALVARLSTKVARARSAVTGAHSPAWTSVGRFAVVSFPAMAYRARWWWLATATGSLLVALVMGWWIARSPGVQASLLPPDQTRSTIGLGAIITDAANKGNFPLLLASTLVMAGIVITGNRLIWRRLYGLAATRYRLD